MNEMERLYLEQGYNCAETVIRLVNEKYGLGIEEADLNLVSGFGGGMGCGEACGVLCAGICALSRLQVTDKAHATEGFRDRCGELVRTFRRELGAIRCEELKEKYMVPEVRCLKTLELGNAVVEQCLEKALK